MKKDEDDYLIAFLGIKADGLKRLKRHVEEAGVRKIIYETWKRWCNDEMDKKTIDAKKDLDEALLMNKNLPPAAWDQKG